MTAAILLAAAQAMTIVADRIAADNVTKSFAATGHVHATAGVMTIRSSSASRDADGLVRFADDTCVTTCTNDVGHTHWNVTGEVEYQEHDYVILRNVWLKFYELPVFWLPYLYYPLELDNGFSWMPGYTGRWGAYLLTKYSYDIAGDPAHADNTWWLKGATRFDLRWEQGIAVGEDLSWNLGDFGAGEFRVYYAWDQDAEERYGAVGGGDWNYANWGSGVEERRYGLYLRHRWEVTERDAVWLRGSYYSDSYFQSDFIRRTMFNQKSQWFGQDNCGVFWEHLENSLAVGAEVSGRLNDFYAMTGRLPEFYFDVNPMPVFSSPVFYETENRLGWLTRDPAEYGTGAKNAYSYNPGVWAKYRAVRFDTYHRLTAPFRTLEDTLSVVPRVGLRGTAWDDTGRTELTGTKEAEGEGSAFRGILEGGATFAGRGTAWVNEDWQHRAEPYLDVLAQHAWFGGLGGDARPYVFDNLDASMTWEDQFAGRARNLPYSYYGITPGWRNSWSKVSEKGELSEVLDLDAYVAVQFNSTAYDGFSDFHRLAEAGRPNYGKDCFFMPGARLRWRPDDDIMLGARAEYDSDNNTIAFGDVSWRHRLLEDFSYYAQYNLRDHRWWDFSSFGVDGLNEAKIHMVDVGFEHQICDWLAWGPHVRWDIRDGELDAIGTWIDYLTDCLGFRLLLEYENEYTTLDGFRHEDEWSIGFYVYLRCFGADSGNVFMN